LAIARVAALNGIDITPPGCTNRCMVNSMYITQCQDTGCLCHEEHFQKVGNFEALKSALLTKDLSPSSNACTRNATLPTMVPLCYTV
jgi:hypothetical protein